MSQYPPGGEQPISQQMFTRVCQTARPRREKKRVESATGGVEPAISHRRSQERPAEPCTEGGEGEACEQLEVLPAEGFS